MASRRRGRHRKSGTRKPSGDIVQEKPISPQDVARLQPHRRDAPLDMKDSALAETPFGTLYLIGALSGEEYYSGVRFARIVRRYWAVICAPKPDANSIAGAMEPKRGGAEIEDAAERKADYDAAFEALGQAGHTSKLTVSRVAVHGEPIPHKGFGALVRGLRTLREFFELTGSGSV
jgi:hypothetical protein